MSDRNAGSSVSSETRQHTGSEDSGIASLVVIAQLSGVAVSAERLRHLSGLSRPIDALTLVRLARQVTLKARSTTSQISRLAQTPLGGQSERCRVASGLQRLVGLSDVESRHAERADQPGNSRQCQPGL